MASLGRPTDLLANLDRVTSLLAGERAGVFLDIDGTLAPIQLDPSTVTITPRMRDAIATLSRSVTVVALSGRNAQMARAIVGVDGITYVGNHGAQWLQDGVERVVPEAEPYVAKAQRIADAAEAQLGGINGVIVEHKGPSVSLHYRATVDQAAAALAIDRFLDATPGVDAFVRLAGKMLVDLRPAIEVDKGTALSSVVASEDLSSVLVLGDDTTDVDAFLALRRLRDAGRVAGLAVAVRSEGTPAAVLEAADYTLASTEAVEHFLTWLAG
jgi:trehalose 6-phosphate phosphatase